MSQMAQELERRLREMRATSARGRRSVSDNQSASETAMEIEPDVAPATEAGGVQMKAAKTKNAKKAMKMKPMKAKKPRAVSSAPKPRLAKWPLPALDDLRLAPGGITAHGARYIQIAFSTGAVVRLLPVNFAKGKATSDARDLIAAWFIKRL